MALWAFALELPLYLLLKNALKRQRRQGCLSHHPVGSLQPALGPYRGRLLMATVLAASFPPLGTAAVCLGCAGGRPACCWGALSERSGGWGAAWGCALWALGWSQG